MITKKPNYGENTRLCYTDTDNFITEIKSEVTPCKRC